MNKMQSYVLKGKARYAKIVGRPVGGYPNGEGPEEWTFDLVLDKDGLEKLKTLGVADSYIKKTDDGDKYVRFTRKALKRDGTPGKAIQIVDHHNEPWGNTLIGNDSTLNVSFTLNEVNDGRKKKLKPSVLAVQVWDLIPYKPKARFETKQDAPGAENWEQEASE